MTPTATGIRVQGVAKRYGDRIAVADLDLDLAPGRITALLGPSGCGKSTLLRLIAGLEAPDAGRISAGEALLAGPGHFTPPERRSIGLVFQDYALFPHLDVLSNVTFGLRHHPRAERDARAIALLQDLRLEHRVRDWPHTLSGGEQQRVALARALAREPAVVLLDEPFSGLDPHLRADVRKTVLTTLRRAGVAVLMVTHDAEDALSAADDLALMSGGRILQRGTPQDCYLRPVSLAAALMLGQINTIPALVRSGEATTVFGKMAALGQPDGDAAVLARPEALTVAAEGVRGEVLDVRFLGAMSELRIAVAQHVLHVRVAPSEARPGDQVAIMLDEAKAVVVPADRAAPHRR